MIVSDKNVSDALTYLADNPHPIAIARKAVTDAENAAKRVYAEAFLAAEGAVEARRAKAETSQEYRDAKDVESRSILSLETHKSRCKAAEMIIEIWRSENANARAAERVR
jgi:hypothetical protein